ncbi:MAG TPA: GNAT family N-acetyltransferase [Telluria sp.]|nr:GNAT family N-acetyltransferase [Telluria sp.]
MSSLPLPRSASAIRPATAADAAGICAIYNHFIAIAHYSFEEAPVAVADMETRIANATCWLAHADEDGAIAGYAYATPWRTRSGYRFSAEASVYVKEGREGQGIGAALYRQLIDELEGRGVHAVMAGIAQPNEASVALHERVGFEKVAHFREVGFKFGRWIDVGYWERILAAKS